MVDFPINNNIHRIAANTSGAKAIDEKWFSEDITVLTSNILKGSRLVLDFGFPETAIIEITRDGGSTWVPLNSNIEVIGDQNRLIPIITGQVINFRTKSSVTLSYASFGEI